MFDCAVTVSPRAIMELPVVTSELTKLLILLCSSVWVLTSHSVSQTVAPSAASLQVMQEVAPTTALAEPAAQSLQVEIDVAAVADENVPAGQKEQAEDSSPVAASVRYFPEAHSMQ